MKGLIIRGVSVSSILFFFISCTISKINPIEEKKIVVDKDYYTVKYYKNKDKLAPKFNIKVFVYDEKYILDYFFVDVNSVLTTVSDTVFNCVVRSDRKHNIEISAMGFRGMSIRNIKVSEKDSVVIKVCLNEGEVLY